MNEEIERIQLTLKQAEAKIDKATKWQKLLANPLFDELVTRDYLGNDAVRLTMNLKPKAEDNEVTNSLLLSKSALSRFVAQVLDEGDEAASSIAENTELMREIDAEVV